MFNLDPFNGCITLPSYCQMVYRALFMPKDSIGIIPSGGYNTKTRYSNKSIKWLMWESHKRDIRIQHARNGGEKKFGSFYVDGFHEASKTIFEFDGCYFHGCNRCYNGNTYNEVNHCFMKSLNLKSADRLQKLKTLVGPEYTFVIIRECEYKKLLAENLDMNTFVKKIDLQDPINPRDALFGGRTAPTKLHHLATIDEIIYYLDFTSLYPTVQKYDLMPIGHPVILQNVTYEVGMYFGLVKCIVLPPQHLYHPVLPMKIHDKLMFPLCRMCSELKQSTECEHEDTERQFKGTWTTIEVDEAVRQGYTIISVDEVWHYTNKSQYNHDTGEKGLFSDYVNKLLKIKQEASGYPRGVETEAQKSEYVAKYMQDEGVMLDNIEKNPGLRSVAKFMLNNLWGKFAQREDLPHTEYISQYEQLLKLLQSDTRTVTDAHLVNKDVMMITSKHAEEIFEVSGKTNLVIAAYTTAHARLRLYKLLDTLKESVLYMDTDSVIYVANKNLVNPLEHLIGDNLGQLTDEIKDKYSDGNVYITEFVSGGAKNYGYLLNNRDSVWKVKGITANYTTEQVINFKVIRSMVMQRVPDDTIMVFEARIVRNKRKCTLTSLQSNKRYRVVYDKGYVGESLRAYPYGFIKTTSGYESGYESD